MAEITRPLPQAVSPAPMIRSTRRRQDARNSIRRSCRIAMTSNTRPALERAQCVLMRKLGIINPQETMTQEARDAYIRLFDHPLSRPHLEAVAALFGWSIPVECEMRSAELLGS